MEAYKTLVNQTRGSPFKINVYLPPAFLDNEELWKIFWKGIPRLQDRGQDYIFPGGVDIIYAAGMLGCLILETPHSFNSNLRNHEKLIRRLRIIPGDVKIAIEFHHRSWAINVRVRALFAKHPNWCFVKAFIENDFVSPGWAGPIQSTRLDNFEPPIRNDRFAFFNFNGVYGNGLGSYDQHFFLETFMEYLDGLCGLPDRPEIFCSFSNGESTVAYPLPNVDIMGLIQLCPRIGDDDPSLDTLEDDEVCCIHDALHLIELYHNIQSGVYYEEGSGTELETRYRTDEDNKIMIEFL